MQRIQQARKSAAGRKESVELDTSYLEFVAEMRKTAQDKDVKDKKGTQPAKYYKDLKYENKSFIDNVELNIHVIKEGTRKDLALRFRNINEGIALNDQEKRNAIVKYAKL